MDVSGKYNRAPPVTFTISSSAPSYYLSLNVQDQAWVLTLKLAGHGLRSKCHSDKFPGKKQLRALMSEKVTELAQEFATWRSTQNHSRYSDLSFLIQWFDDYCITKRKSYYLLRELSIELALMGFDTGALELYFSVEDYNYRHYVQEYIAWISQYKQPINHHDSLLEWIDQEHPELHYSCFTSMVRALAKAGYDTLLNVPIAQKDFKIAKMAIRFDRWMQGKTDRSLGDAEYLLEWLRSNNQRLNYKSFLALRLATAQKRYHTALSLPISAEDFLSLRLPSFDTLKGRIGDLTREYLGHHGHNPPNRRMQTVSFLNELLTVLSGYDDTKKGKIVFGALSFEIDKIQNEYTFSLFRPAASNSLLHQLIKNETDECNERQTLQCLKEFREFLNNCPIQFEYLAKLDTLRQLSGKINQLEVENFSGARQQYWI